MSQEAKTMGSARRKIGRRSSFVVTVCVLAVGAAGASVALAASSGHAAGAAVNLQIGDVAPLTGANAAFGPSWIKAAQIAASDANAAAQTAGINLTVTVNSADEGDTPQTAVSATRQLVSEGDSCILGGTSSSNSIAMAEAVTIPGHVVQISPASSSVLYGNLHANGGYTFRTLPSDALGTQVLAAVMAAKLGGAKGKLVSVAARNDSYGGPAAKGFVAAWKKLGGKVEGPVLYDPNASSYDSEAAQIVKGHPAAFVIYDFPATYAKVGAALLRTGKFSAKKLFTTAGFPSTIPSGFPTAALQGGYVISPGEPPAGVVLSAFNSAFSASTLSPSAQQPYSVNNFDAAMLCILGAEAAHSSSGSSIASKLLSTVSSKGKKYDFLQLGQAFAALNANKPIDYVGVSGSTQLDSSGDPTGTVAAVTQYQHSKLVTVETVKLANGKLTQVK
jgi:branched-chain amino acid transport system substrate-binding protein